MPLDVAILNDDGYPSDTVSIGVLEHAQLIEVAREERLKLLLRMANFYEDVEVQFDEVDEFICEIEKVIDKKAGTAIRGILDKLIALAQKALKNRRGIVAIAD